MIAVVGDSGCSMRPEYPEVQESGVSLAPIKVIFSENRKAVSYSDFQIGTKEFYEKMENSKKLPTTDGSIQGEAITIYRKLSERFNKIISVHLTSGESTVYSSAINAAEIVKLEKPGITINVIDSRQVSLASWLPTQETARLADKGCDINEIGNSISEMIPKIRIEVALKTITNVVKGGRAKFLGRFLNAMVPVRPVLTLKDGRLSLLHIQTSFRKAREKIYEDVKEVIKTSSLTNLTVVHTNVPDLAGEFADSLKRLYKGEIKIFDAGAALAVHAGEGALAVVYQFT